MHTHFLHYQCQCHSLQWLKDNTSSIYKYFHLLLSFTGKLVWNRLNWLLAIVLDVCKMVLNLNHVWPFPDKTPQYYWVNASCVKGHKLVETETISSTAHLYFFDDIYRRGGDAGSCFHSPCVHPRYAVFLTVVLSGMFFLSSLESKSDTHKHQQFVCHPSGSPVNLFLLCSATLCTLRLCAQAVCNHHTVYIKRKKII